MNAVMVCGVKSGNVKKIKAREAIEELTDLYFSEVRKHGL